MRARIQRALRTPQMADLSVGVDIAQPQTPGELADLLGVSLVTVLKALVGRSRYVLPSQPVDTQAALEVARDLGFSVKGSKVTDPAPATRELKPNWPAFRLSVQRRRLRELYHFTAPENLDGIMAAGGLLSRRRKAEQHIQAAQHGWGCPDKERTLGADYICLSITGGWPMMGSLMAQGVEPPLVLIVEPRVIWYRKTCFSPLNSASREVDPVQLQAWTDLAHFEALFPDPQTAWPTDDQAEVLVHERVSIDDIRQIVFHSQEAFSAARERCGLDQGHPLIAKICISRRYHPPLGRQAEARGE